MLAFKDNNVPQIFIFFSYFIVACTCTIKNNFINLELRLSLEKNYRPNYVLMIRRSLLIKRYETKFLKISIKLSHFFFQITF
jgi:hypothetical protein